MGSQGFIEPPPGLFGETPPQRGASVEPAPPRLTIRASAAQAPLPALPRLTPPARIEPAVEAAPGVEASQDIEAVRDVEATPGASPRAAEPWPTTPSRDLPGDVLPDFPRLVAPQPPPQPSQRTEAPGASAGAAVPGDLSLPEWSLVLADGVAIPLYGPVIVGRKPSNERFPGATLAAVPDTTRTMSKTHARFFLQEGVPMVDDLGSTNGIALFPGGNTQGAMAVEPGSPAEVRSGDVVQLGEYEISVHRN